MTRPKAVIDRGFLVQRHADSPDDAAEDLAARRLGVQDASGRDRADDAGDADHAELLVDLDLGEDRGMGVVGAPVVFGGVGGDLPLDLAHAALPHGIGDGDRPRAVAPAHQPAVRERDIGRVGAGQGRARDLLCQAQQLLADRVRRPGDAVGDRGRNP